MKNNVTTGIVLVVIGFLILLHQSGINILSFGILKSSGLIVLGGYIFYRGIHSKATGLSFLGSFLLFLGIYYGLAEMHLFWPTRGLNLSFFTIFAGLSFYMNYLFNRRNLSQLLFGNLLLILGIFFFLHYLGRIPAAVFVTIVDRYWPVLLILIGVVLVIQALLPKKERPAGAKN